MRLVYRFGRSSILPEATMINFIVSQTTDDFRTETPCVVGHPITGIARGPQMPHRERAVELLKRPALLTQHTISATKKGRLAGGPSIVTSDELFAGPAPQLLPAPGLNIKGLVGLASGLTMSSVAPARSVCCSVRSPMCSFSPSRTRLSLTFAPLDASSYLVSEPWYLANTENGAVANRHSPFTPHVQVWKPMDGSELRSILPLAYATVPSIRKFGLMK